MGWRAPAPPHTDAGSITAGSTTRSHTTQANPLAVPTPVGGLTRHLPDTAPPADIAHPGVPPNLDVPQYPDALHT